MLEIYGIYTWKQALTDIFHFGKQAESNRQLS